MLAALSPSFFPLHAKPDDDILPLEGWRYLTAWDFHWFPVLMLLLVAGIYLYGVHLLTRRGDRWPVHRTVLFMVGLAVLAIGMFSAVGVYDTVLFWIHMVQHMLFSMIAPPFLVGGAPVTLALRTLPVKPRQWLLAVLHSMFAKVILFPPLTTAIMVGTPFALYFTGWYELTLRNDFQHDLLHFWMITMGCLFFFPLLGVDPVPLKMPYPIRILLFFLTMPFHAFLGVIIMGSKTLIAEEWYLSFERDWGPSPLRDQSLAGGLMWATGDITMLAAMVLIFIQWIRESNREAKRIDRALDREEAEQAKRAAARYDVQGQDSHPEEGIQDE
ncbi:MAG: cytochrome c oxidase assembly protein [Tessaracoccus sp.]